MSAQARPGAVGRVDRGFLAEVSSVAGGVSRLQMCIQCGTCGGSCPSAADMGLTRPVESAIDRAADEVMALIARAP